MKTKLIIALLVLNFNSFAQPAGDLDPSFGIGGKVVTSIGSGEDKAYGVIIQDDNKIIVAGYSYSLDTGNDFVLVRYEEDGTLDASFGVGGIVKTDVQLGSDDRAYDLALQADGKIVVAGSSDNGIDRDAALVRYNGDGTIDESFGVAGVVLTDFEDGKSDEIRVVKIHALTGNIIVGGSAVISTTKSKPVVARYLINGDLDLSFETDGIRLLWIDPLDYQYLFSVEDLVVQSSGKITAVGWRDYPDISWSSDYWAGRINSDGTMDVTFATDGVNHYNGAFNANDKAYSMILNPDNSFHFSGGGHVSTLKYDFTLFSITNTGSVGPGAGLADYGEFLNDVSYSVAKDLDGSFVMAGSTGDLTYKDFAISKLTPSFSLDSDFGTGGKVTTSFGTSDFNEAFNMLIQLDNKIVAVGYSGNDFALARYLGVDSPELDGFTLQTPTNVAINQNYASLAFNWTDAFGASTYEFILDVSPDFDVAPITLNPAASAQTITDLEPSQEYFWKVKASDGVVWGEYSDTWSFTTNSLENFNLVSPTNGASGVELTDLILDWSTAIGADEYEVQIDTDAAFGDAPLIYSTSGTNYTLSGLDPETTYYWRVRASNDGVTFGDWTSTWHFETTSDLSIKSVENNDLKLEIYPNPVSGKFNLNVSEKLIGSNYSIIDITGKVVDKGTINSENSLVYFDFSPGYYILQIENNPLLSTGFTNQ